MVPAGQVDNSTSPRGTVEGEGPGPRPHSGAGRVGEWRNISTRASGVWGVVCEGEKIACRWRDQDEQGGGGGAAELQWGSQTGAIPLCAWLGWLAVTRVLRDGSRRWMRVSGNGCAPSSHGPVVVEGCCPPSDGWRLEARWSQTLRGYAKGPRRVWLNTGDPRPPPPLTGPGAGDRVWRWTDLNGEV